MISTQCRSSSYHRSLEMLQYSLAAPICAYRQWACVYKFRDMLQPVAPCAPPEALGIVIQQGLATAGILHPSLICKEETMQNYEIPREEWPQAVTAFGDEHRRWLVSIDVVGDELGAQPEVRNLPLDGITADPPDKGGLVSIFVERSPDDHLTRNIEH